MTKNMQTKRTGGLAANLTNKLAMGLMVATALSACGTRNAYQTSGRNGLTAPPGMVYVPSGTITYASLADSTEKGKTYSVSAFFIDKTEVTNEEYMKFINWVADSVAVTDYLKDEQYFLKEKGLRTVATGAGSTATSSAVVPTRKINWSKLNTSSPLWKSKKGDIQSKLAPMFVMNAGQLVLNPETVKYRFSYRKAGGGNNNQYVTDTVSVTPEMDIWSKDFPNAQMALYDRNYMTHKAFKNNPVVGVNWKQARAYADWKGKEMSAAAEKNPYLRGFNLAYSLPTEAQWQLAASGTNNGADTSAQKLTTLDKKTKKQLLAINYKQDDGSYSNDGSTFTVPVTSYAPNGFGLYNMLGNVSEWTMDAYSPSTTFFVNDLNPVLLYDANTTDGEALRRKVVRGGSWKDPGSALNVDARGYETQNLGHSYIGFRCAMSAIEMASPQLKAK